MAILSRARPSKACSTAAAGSSASGSSTSGSSTSVVTWNAAHVLPESGANKKKLEETVALLPQQPDLIFVQEMHFYKRTGGSIDSAKSQSKLAAVRELLNGYDLHVAERAPSEDHEFVKGAGVFVRRGGRLTGGRF